MRANIYVFSGTGNSLAVADKIAHALGGDTIVKLIPNILQSEAKKEILAESDAVGFVFPNYFGGIPQIVSQFINRINLDKATYLFSIVTAAVGQGYGLKLLEEALNEKGKKLSYGKYVSTVKSNYIIGWYYRLVNMPRGQNGEKYFQEMEAKIAEFAQDIVRKKVEVQSSSYLAYMRSHLLSKKEIRENTCPWDKEFSVNNECVGCGICKNVCQAKNILICDNKAYFQHNCFRCMACFQYCPKNAIEYKGKRLNKEKYYHPEYPARVLINRINAV